MQWRFGLGLLAGLAISVGGAVWAAADGDAATDSVPRVVPYQGILEQDGVSVHGTRNMRFALYDTDNATLDLNDALWREEWSNRSSADCAGNNCPVVVRSGHFAVRLGRYVDIMPAIAAADDVCLAIQVRRSGTWHALGGCQQITPAPYALWSAAGSNPTIAGNLTVNGHVGAATLGATGAVTGASVAATGAVTGASVTATSGVSGHTVTSTGVTQAGTGVRITGGGVWQGSGRPNTNDLGLYSNTSGRHVRYVSNGAPHRFYTDAASDRIGSSIDFEIEADGDAVAHNAMTIHGAARINGALTFDGRDTTNYGVNNGFDDSTDGNFGVWGSFTNCPANQYVCGIRQQYDARNTDKDNWGVMDLQIKCCTFGR